MDNKIDNAHFDSGSDLSADADEAVNPEVVDRALLSAIIRRGSLCLSQASLRTGFGIISLSAAKDRLLERDAIRVRAGSQFRESSQVSYELNI